MLVIRLLGMHGPGSRGCRLQVREKLGEAVLSILQNFCLLGVPGQQLRERLISPSLLPADTLLREAVSLNPKLLPMCSMHEQRCSLWRSCKIRRV